MFINVLNNNQIIKSGMDKCLQRNQILASNIANAETPGFKAKDVFINIFNPINSDTLRYNAKDFSFKTLNYSNTYMGVNYTIKERTDVDPKENGNTVDMGKEMTSIVENVLEYNALVQALSKKLSGMEYAINDRR